MLYRRLKKRRAPQEAAGQAHAEVEEFRHAKPKRAAPKNPHRENVVDHHRDQASQIREDQSEIRPNDQRGVPTARIDHFERLETQEEKLKREAFYDAIRKGADVQSQTTPEPVFLSASVPQSVVEGERFVARFGAYLKTQEAEMRQLLEGLSPQSRPLMGLRYCRWALGTPVLVRLEGRHLTVETPEQQFKWEGEKIVLDFEVMVDSQAAQNTTARFSVVVDGFLIASLHIDILVGPSVSKRRKTVEGQTILNAFASYSSKDRSRVLDRVDSIQTSTGIEVFVDCLDLHPNEEWKRIIEGRIPSSDLFLLFWSRSAKASQYVAWELETAIRTRGRRLIEVHALEPNVAPPEALKDVHVSSPLMWIREGNESVFRKGEAKVDDGTEQI